MTDEPTGKAKGGIARALALSPERKSSIARSAAMARWGEKPLHATHRGNFKEEFGIDVGCYVLDDDQKTAVISQTGMAPALGLVAGSGGQALRFVNSARMAPYVGAELAEKLKKPLVFQWFSPVPGNPTVIVNGYDVTILIDICKAVLQAHIDGKLQKRHQNMVRQANIILNASAKAGIKGLVYALAGYDATKEEVIAAFKTFVREEAREYEKEFPDQLYTEWYRLYQLPRPEKNKPWKFKHLTIRHVYYPLARSSGRVLDLLKALRARGPERHKKLHQFLSDTGVKALRTHLGQLAGIAQVSDDREMYERYFDKIFGRQQSLDFSKRT
jgi:hypothetical protein